MKKTFAVATIVLMASSLAGCGGNSDSNGSGDGSGGSGASGGSGGSSSSGDYCSTLQSVKDEVTSGGLDSLSQANFDNFESKIGDIQAAAPSDVADDWKTFGDYLSQFNGLLKDAGITLDDLQGMQTGGLPPGVDQAKLAQLATKLSSLSSTLDVAGASKAITASAKSDCDIDLNDTSGSPASGAPSS